MEYCIPVDNYEKGGMNRFFEIERITHAGALVFRPTIPQIGKTAVGPRFRTIRHVPSDLHKASE